MKAPVEYVACVFKKILVTENRNFDVFMCISSKWQGFYVSRNYKKLKKKMQYVLVVIQNFSLFQVFICR